MPTLASLWTKPEITKLFWELYDKLFNESTRGALLIATTYVDEHLSELLKVSFPKKMSKNQIDKLFNYPGPLSSFSAKIELSYAFRLVDFGLYRSLNGLRKLRNEAAHSASQMQPEEMGKKMHEVYTHIGQGWRTNINKHAAKMLIDNKLQGLEELFDKHQVSQEDRKKHVDELLRNKETLENLEKVQLPYWEMLIGLCFICSLIVYYKYKILSIPANVNTWSDFVPDIEEEKQTHKTNEVSDQSKEE